MSGTNTQAIPIFHFSVETTQHVMINQGITDTFFSQEHMKLSRPGTKVKLQSMVGVNFSLSNLTLASTYKVHFLTFRTF